MERRSGRANSVEVMGLVLPLKLSDGTEFRSFIISLPPGSITINQLTRNIMLLLEGTSDNPHKSALELFEKFIESPNLAKISSFEQPAYSTIWDKNSGEQIYFPAQNVDTILNSDYTQPTPEERILWPKASFLTEAEWKLVQGAFSGDQLQEDLGRNIASDWPTEIVVDYPLDEVKERLQLPDGTLWLDDLERKLLEVMNRNTVNFGLLPSHHDGSLNYYRRGLFWQLPQGMVISVKQQMNIFESKKFISPDGFEYLKRFVADPDFDASRHKGIGDVRIGYLSKALKELLPVEDSLDGTT